MPEVMLLPRTRLKSRTDVAHKEVGGESVLLSLRHGRYFALNEVGSVAWNHLSAGASLLETRDALVAGFDVAPDTAWTDLVALVRELLAHELVDLDPRE